MSDIYRLQSRSYKNATHDRAALCITIPIRERYSNQIMRNAVKEGLF